MNHSYVLGDARIQVQYWNLFDFYRRKKGADIAICDGIEFGKLLLLDSGEGEHNCAFDKFRPLTQQRRQVAWSMIKFAMLVAVLPIVLPFLYQQQIIS